MKYLNLFSWLAEERLDTLWVQEVIFIVAAVVATTCIIQFCVRRRLIVYPSFRHNPIDGEHGPHGDDEEAQYANF